MIRHLLLAFALSLSAIGAFGQNDTIQWLNGVYPSPGHLEVNQPQAEFDLKIEVRTAGDIVMLGGNDYRVICPSGSLSKKQIRNEVFAVAKNDSIYINCLKHNLQPGYALGLTGRPYIAFWGAMSMDRANPSMAMGGAIGGAIVASNRYLYVMNLKHGNVLLLNESYLSSLLRETNKELHMKFENESDKKSSKTLIKYIDLLNELEKR